MNKKLSDPSANGVESLSWKLLVREWCAEVSSSYNSRYCSSSRLFWSILQPLIRTLNEPSTSVSAYWSKDQAAKITQPAIALCFHRSHSELNVSQSRLLTLSLPSSKGGSERVTSLLKLDRENKNNRFNCIPLTLSLLRVINVKFPLQPHQKYYITQ